MSQLAERAKCLVRDLDPTNELTFVRIASKKHEVETKNRGVMFRNQIYPRCWSLLIQTTSSLYFKDQRSLVKKLTENNLSDVKSRVNI